MSYLYYKYRVFYLCINENNIDVFDDGSIRRFSEKSYCEGSWLFLVELSSIQSIIKRTCSHLRMVIFVGLQCFKAGVHINAFIRNIYYIHC